MYKFLTLDKMEINKIFLINSFLFILMYFLIIKGNFVWNFIFLIHINYLIKIIIFYFEKNKYKKILINTKY